MKKILSVSGPLALIVILILCLKPAKTPKAQFIDGFTWTDISNHQTWRGDAITYSNVTFVANLRSNAIAGHTTIYSNNGVIHYIYWGSNDSPALQAAILNSNAYSQDGLHLYRVRTH